MMSRQSYLFLGALALGAVACAAAAPPPVGSSPNGTVAKGPLGPPASSIAHAPDPEPLPPDAITKPVPKEKLPDDLADNDARDDGVLGPMLGAAPPPPPSDPLATAAPARGAVHQGEGKSVFGGEADGTGGAGKAGQIGAASEVRGSIDKEEIRRVVQAHVSEVKRCYEQALARQPGLEGRVVLKFTIGKTGTVVATNVQETSLNDRQVEQCMVAASLKWTFPKPKGEGMVTFTYPFTLKSGS